MISSVKRVKLSQNFLKDGNILKKIENSLPYLKGKSVIEFGPGEGSLTEVILAKKPLKLLLVELDLKYVEFVKKKFLHLENVEIIEMSCLDYKIVENYLISSIPYSITKEIFKKMVISNSLKESFLVVQKEFAQKVCDVDFLPISLYTNIFFKVEKLFDIKKGSFFPKPDVDSSFIHLKRIKKFTKRDIYLWDFLNFLTQNRNRDVKKYFNSNDNKKIGKLSLKEILKIYADEHIRSHQRDKL